MDSKEMGSLGGRARAKSLSPERRREIAKIAIQARWDKYREQQADNAWKRAFLVLRARVELAPRHKTQLKRLDELGAWLGFPRPEPKTLAEVFAEEE